MDSFRRAIDAGLRFGLPDHLTTTGQASGQANYYMVKQVAKTTSWSGVGGQASGPSDFRRKSRKILLAALLSPDSTCQRRQLGTVLVESYTSHLQSPVLY